MAWRNVLSPRNSRNVKSLLSHTNPLEELAWPQSYVISRKCEEHEGITPHLRQEASGSTLPFASQLMRAGSVSTWSFGAAPGTLLPRVVQAQMGPRRDPQYCHLTDCRGAAARCFCLRRRRCGQRKAPKSAVRPLSTAPPSGSVANAPTFSRELPSVGII